eukprot:TRINITY_DN15665_c0_g1_i1.p1 TRINITY_DN15665_c0_g1~~TRINITY_DN15665_c0_g1_i1.p1  ORF type:complete len:294 (+),score=32.86 TRINITY_DN15665_c0_g1_i1:62-883(+)
MRALRRHSIDLKLHPWNSTSEEINETIESVKETVEKNLKTGEGGSLKIVGAKSVIAAVKGLALAEESLTGGHESAWGGEGGMTCIVERENKNFHTFVIRYTKEGFQFPESARMTDVLDKSELTEDIYQWAAATPTNYWTDEPLQLDFNKDSPEYKRPYHLSSAEFVENILTHPKNESIVRGMGPSIFNCLQVISHATNAIELPVHFSPRHLPVDSTAVSTFKDDIRDYFERGMVHFRDTDALPSRRADGKVLTPPEDFDESDYFTVAFGVRIQ